MIWALLKAPNKLKDFFSAINEEKRKLKEQQENDKKKLIQLEQLLFAKDKEKTESEKFAGAVDTYCIEAMMGDKRALQAAFSLSRTKFCQSI